MDLSNIEPASGQGNTNEWYTPRWILDACGEFDLDPCGNNRWDTANEVYEYSGIEREWKGRVWMNPPYGRDIGQWTDKLVEHGNGLCLIFGRTDTRWFQRFAPHCSWVLCLAGRVSFVNAITLQESKRNPGAPSILCAVGNQPRPNLKGIFLEPQKLRGTI